MRDKAVYKLAIDPEFKALICPLYDNEYQKLEEDILKDGCRDPLIIWEGIIIDGHNRYEICRRLQISFAVTEKDFSCREAAMAWICANQLGRRNLSEEMRKYLIGMQYESEKTAGQIPNTSFLVYERPSKVEQETQMPLGRQMIAARIAKQNHITLGTVQKYAQYARSIEMIRKKAPEIVPKILSGIYKISHNNMVALASYMPEEIKRVFGEIERRQSIHVQHKKTRAEIQQISQKTIERTKDGVQSVKDMPPPDPDAEVTGLMLTIPSWVSSMERIQHTADFKHVSTQSIQKLISTLKNLEQKTKEILSDVRGELNGRL